MIPGYLGKKLAQATHNLRMIINKSQAFGEAASEADNCSLPDAPGIGLGIQHCNVPTYCFIIWQVFPDTYTFSIYPLN